jgi:rRNA maturation protein Nop10
MTYCLPQALLSVQRKSSLVTDTKTGAATASPMSVPVRFSKSNRAYKLRRDRRKGVRRKGFVSGDLV